MQRATMAMQDVIIVGAGLAGLSSAASLAARGLDVLVFEAAARPSRSFRGELLHAKGVRLLRSLGLSSALETAAGVAGFAAMQAGNSAAIRLPYAPEGGTGAGFEHHAFVAALRRDVGGYRRVRLESPVSVDALHFERGRVAGVRTSDGVVHRARLVVAADGRHSRIRRLFGVHAQPELLSYTVVASLARSSLPEPDYGHVLLGGPGPVLAYPYAAEHARVCIDVPLTVAAGQAKLRAFVTEQYGPDLAAAFGCELLRTLGRDRLAATANHALTVERSVVQGGVLVGDAGGCSHPLTATGMTSALNDAVLLAEAVARDGLEDAAFERYARNRRRFVNAREAFASALYDVLRGGDHGTRTLRAGVFRYWDGSDRARRASMAVLSGDDSRATAFVTEFARVFGVAALTVLETAARTGQPRQALRSLLELGRAGRYCLAHLAREPRPT
jgi:squalene monooxygenase